MAKKTKKNNNDPKVLFQNWWEKKGGKLVSKMEKQYIKENPEYDPDDEDGSDGGCVHRLFHEGEAYNMTYDIAESVFLKGHNNETWEPNQSDSLYCELDTVIELAYQEGVKCRK